MTARQLMSLKKIEQFTAKLFEPLLKMGKWRKVQFKLRTPFAWWEIEGEWSIGMEVKVLMTSKFKFSFPSARCFLISEENEDNFDCNSSSAWNCIHNLPYATWPPFSLHLSFTYPNMDNPLHYFDHWRNTNSYCWVLVLVKTYLLAFKQITWNFRPWFSRSSTAEEGREKLHQSLDYLPLA